MGNRFIRCHWSNDKNLAAKDAEADKGVTAMGAPVCFVDVIRYSAHTMIVRVRVCFSTHSAAIPNSLLKPGSNRLLATTTISTTTTTTTDSNAEHSDVASTVATMTSTTTTTPKAPATPTTTPRMATGAAALEIEEKQKLMQESQRKRAELMRARATVRTTLLAQQKQLGALLAKPSLDAAERQRLLAKQRALAGEIEQSLAADRAAVALAAERAAAAKAEALTRVSNNAASMASAVDALKSELRQLNATSTATTSTSTTSTATSVDDATTGDDEQNAAVSTTSTSKSDADRAARIVKLQAQLDRLQQVCVRFVFKVYIIK